MVRYASRVGSGEACSMYDAPSMPQIREVVISEEVIESSTQPLLMYLKEAAGTTP